MPEQKTRIQQDKGGGAHAWIVSVNMGFGHQRAARPLRHLSPTGEIVNANDYPTMPDRDKTIWERSRSFYEYISRAAYVPWIGSTLFALFDSFQKITRFYPKKAVREPSAVLRQNYNLIKQGWGSHLIKMLAADRIPLVTTFFTAAYMAEAFSYPGDINCVICDTDISRTWAPFEPKESRIRYFVPTREAEERLARYGVAKERVIRTGFPLPKELLGSPKYETAAHDLGHRLINLDPKETYRTPYKALIRDYLGELPEKADHPLTILFSIGGAGAQKDIVLAALESLSGKIRNGAMRFIVAAGTRPESKAYWMQKGNDLHLGTSFEVLSRPRTADFFDTFNETLRTTDILWTKPSELTFYAALGIPIIVAPPLGSHEVMNRKWLLRTGAGVPQEDPASAEEWISDYLAQGIFAEAAMQGFVEMEKGGTYAIERVISEQHGLARA